jgi:hypothetical protein
MIKRKGCLAYTNTVLELITPALQGTSGIMKSVLKNGYVSISRFVLTSYPATTRTEVKRIVVTSSCAAVISIGAGFRSYNETDWNEDSIKEIEFKGRDATGMAKYQASKTLAEKGMVESSNES